jgi:RNA 3'-terminal phosphate cyclase
MRQIGYDSDLILNKAGYYPKGGGKISMVIRPHRQLKPLQILDRGKLLSISGISAVSNLKMSIAYRQKKQALKRLNDTTTHLRLKDIKIKSTAIPSLHKGCLFLLHAEFDSGGCCYFALGELGKPAELVADEAFDTFMVFMNSKGAIDEFLADQLLLPLSLVPNDSAISTSRVTRHLLTNANIIERFLPVKIEIPGVLGKPCRIHILHD